MQSVAQSHEEPSKTMSSALTVNVRQARLLIGCGRTTVYGALASGRLRHVRIGRRILIPLIAIDEFLAGSEHFRPLQRRREPGK